MTDRKEKLSPREQAYVHEHTLTKEQLHELIRAKLERAERMRMQPRIEERKQIYT
jgi:hypothetical protein